MHVLFDLDGTLIDSIELIINSAKHAFRDRPGGPPSDEEWLSGVGIPLVTMMRRYADSDAEVDALIAKYREYQLAHHDRLVRCYDTVADTLAALRAEGHALGVVTSKASWLARRGLDHVGIGSYFDVVVGCDTCDTHKPDPGPVLHALAQLGGRPDDAVFVGDSIYDIQAGNAAGVISIAALWGPFPRATLAPSNPAYYLNSMAELPALLAGIRASGNHRSPSIRTGRT